MSSIQVTKEINAHKNVRMSHISWGPSLASPASTLAQFFYFLFILNRVLTNENPLLLHTFLS